MNGSNMRDKARAIFGKTFFENTKEPAPAKNGAVALQKRANARPIPTYKVGGVVKKQAGGALTPAEKARAEKMIRERGDAAMRDPLVMRLLEEQNRAPMGVPGAGPKAATKRAEGGGIEAQRLEARTASGNYKKGGKIKKKADGGVMDQYSGMPAPLQQPVAAATAYDGSSYGAGPKPLQPMVANPNMPAPAYKKGGKVMKKSNGGTAATAAKPAPSALMRSLKPQDYQKAQAARAAAATPAAKAAARAKATANVARDAALKTSMTQNAQQAAVRKQRSDAAAAAYKNTFMGKQAEINKMKAANAASMAQNNQKRAANATARAANQARQVELDRQAAARTPVNRAAGGAGKTRKGMC